MSWSLRHPARNPPESVLMIVVDHGPEGGGWGPAYIDGIGPFVYTAGSPEVLTAAHELAQRIAHDEGKAARVVRFTARDDLGIYEP